jgi:glycerophosphoryl diester phosphodiesterase
VYGHRGASADAPENTLAAFRVLQSTPARGVELDIRLCASGEIVVSHDDSMERTAGATARISRTTLSDLQQYDVGAWFAQEFRGERVPLLSDVFDLLGGDFQYDIEIKPYGHDAGRSRVRIETALRDLVVSRGLAGRCMVSSFDPFVVRRFSRLESGVPTALIYGQRSRMPVPLRRGRGRLVCRPDVLKPHYSEVTRELVKREHRYNRTVVPWTVDDPDTAIELARLGVDGIITNVPSLIVEALRAG